MAQSFRRYYCSVPYCSSNKQKHPYLSFHEFPFHADTSARWVRAIKREEGLSFRVLRGSTYVCSQHFDSEDEVISVSGRIRIKRGAVPSRFHWNDWGRGSKPSVLQRERKLLAGAMAKDHNYACCSRSGDPDSSTQRTTDLKLQLQSPNIDLQQQPLIFKFCSTDADCRYYTRFSSMQVFTVFWESVYPSASRLVKCSEALQAAHGTPSPQPELPLIDELFMFLCRVAAGIQERTLSSIFDVSVSSVRHIIVSWTRYLYLILGSLPVWMTREQVQATMPERLKLCYPQLRVIIERTEIHCETASSLSLHSQTVSNCTNPASFKGLIGIAPCGVITFVSRLFTDSISDEEVTERSQIKQLLEPGDAVIADRGFLTERMMSELGATLESPPLSVEDSHKTRALNHVSVLGERTIRRVKEHHIWDGPVPLSVVDSVDQLWVVCCLMSNYQGALES
ncbi:uncharacterized protein si:cabz01071907.1 [Notolabrus celidotus]|uniref:uncharacterized protein si:cabz01071907.1 n=1 Tax=Notolabrus celidotus TaxID=1203425 RepID=UPI0014900A1E|nr:uncharacterized protein si:cabz01071907.1 [Notolabrus celidotus]XP_034555424.1 uncharacterized protein si:cabz01071907.1 [Notolabrus celidotus]XP_034555425.1 uncharacterized protein si:cabz01071907.1 [Notolabrus celidotus]